MCQYEIESPEKSLKNQNQIIKQLMYGYHYLYHI